MRAKTIIIIVIVLAAGLGVFVVRDIISRRHASATKSAKEIYYCPMHPTFTSDRPGDCQICGMSLVKKTAEAPATEQVQPEYGQRKILYYRNPMNPEITSPVPMKDEMGMDYVPVYEEEKAKTGPSGVYINPQKQQLIGVTKAKVQKRNLTGRILAVGRVAYDPALFTAQQEYLQALKSNQLIQKDREGYISDQSASLIASAKQKLLLMGMSESELKQLEEIGRPEQNLYLPGKTDKNIWIYASIYEYETQLVKVGTPVEVRAQAYPGRMFEGKIVAIAPILEPATRSLKVRALIDNPDDELKLEMYVDVAINYELGEKLAVPEEAVMHAGTRDVVFVAKPDSYFESRVVTLGAKARAYYEVLQGLSENDEVVTSGNFLIDSESKLNAVLTKAAEPNK
jgi:hypothetical protein